jgi:hypothetical protein
LSLGFVVACGSSSANNPGDGSPQASPTPNPGATPTPTPVVDGNVCTPKKFEKGVTVYYAGPKGNTQFPDANKAYIGTVVNIFNNGTAEVTWPHATNVQVFNFLMPEATCATDVTGARVVYTGTQEAANTAFPDPAAQYLGKIVQVFAGANAVIDWDHLNYDTGESFSNIAIAQ